MAGNTLFFDLYNKNSLTNFAKPLDYFTPMGYNNTSVGQNVTKLHEMEEKTHMLTGKYHHSLDSKNRVVIPSKLKEQLGETVTILRSSDKCLTVYSAEEWQNYADKISQLPKTQLRNITRYLYANSLEVQPDAQGRIMLQPDMLKYAGIEHNVVTVGCGKYAEIWAEEVWNEQNLDDEPEDYTDTLVELGL